LAQFLALLVQQAVLVGRVWADRANPRPDEHAAVVKLPVPKYLARMRSHRTGVVLLLGNLVHGLLALGCSDDEGADSAAIPDAVTNPLPTDSSADMLPESSGTQRAMSGGPQPQPTSDGNPRGPEDGPCLQPPASDDQPDDNQDSDVSEMPGNDVSGDAGTAVDDVPSGDGVRETDGGDVGEGAMGAGGSVGDEVDGGATAPEADLPNPCQEGKVVHFVYFVEADQQYSEAQRDDIERHAFVFQQSWYEQLGVTFYLNDPVVEVIEADHESTWYVETPDDIHTDSRWYRLGNIKKEVYQKLDVRDFDPNHRVVNYPTTRFDGRVGGNFGGIWMDGDDLTCIADDGPTYPYDDGSPAHCLGHPAHEFGHVLGLDHEGPENDCMQYGFYYSSNARQMCDFSEANVQKILDNPSNEGWFQAMPGETCTGIW